MKAITPPAPKPQAVKRRYHLSVIGYYNDSHADSTHQETVECDGMNYSRAGCYEFWVKNGDSYEVIAYYPIRHTIITLIEKI